MNKFVKLEGFEGWFLFMDSEIDIEQVINFNKKSFTGIVSKFLKTTDDGSLEYKNLEMKAKFLMTNNVGINYNQILQKYNQPILIREIGSWMIFHDQRIIETFSSKHFSWPIVDKSSIVICENDLEPEQWWVDYLTERFPEQSIQTLNCFSQRSDDDLRENLEYPSIITFTTTFTQLQWFENLINTIQHQKGKTLIVHWKGGDDVWKNIKIEFETQLKNFELNNRIEIVEMFDY